MNLDDLRVFAKVAELTSFSRAGPASAPACCSAPRAACG